MADADTPDADVPETTRRQIASFLRDWLTDEGLPGVSVAVVRGDECVYASGFGSRDLAANRPATGDTLYGVGSVTKSFAALAVMQLAEAGDLDLDDPATEYLGSGDSASKYLGAGDSASKHLGADDSATESLPVELPEEITVHHLLTHSSGLPSLGASEALIARRAGMGELGVPLGDWDDFHAHVEGGLDERAGDPGERFFYCNSGYVLLGEIVEELSGRPFAEYVEREILDPLGMERSTFRGEAYAADDDSATPYLLGGGDDEDGGGRNGAGGETPEATDLPVRELSAAAGGLASSARELARYVACQRSGGELDGTRLAPEASFDRMHAGHVETDSGPYGYGWRRREVGGEPVVGHSGSIAVSTAYAGFTPDDEWGVAVCCNGAPDYGLRAVGEAVLATLLGGEPTDAPVFARRERLDRLTGTYESYRGIRTAEVTRDGETLRLAFTDEFGGEGSPLIPADDSPESEDGPPETEDDSPETEDGSLETEDGPPETEEFYQLSADGGRQAVEFEVGEEGTDLFVDRWRLHEVS